MINHAMRYVGLTNKLLRDHGEEIHPQVQVDLQAASDRIFHAESELVAAYGEWRDVLKRAKKAGDVHCAEVHRRTTWDLT